MKTKKEYKIYSTELIDSDQFELVFKADTKGGKYSIEVLYDKKWKSYDYNTFVNGKLDGSGCGIKEYGIVSKITNMLRDSANIDGIIYINTLNKLEKLWN